MKYSISQPTLLYFSGIIRQSINLLTSFIFFMMILLPGKISAQVYDSIEDPRDGRLYLTVKIGEQVWMAENLNYKTKKGSSCYADQPSNCSKYGRLYRWDAVNTACPDGWHPSTQHEWHKLVYYLGGPDSAAVHLKLKSPMWNKQNSSDDNSTGFSAIPGGKRDINNTSKSMGYYAYFWTATETSEFAWSTFMSCSGKDVQFTIQPVNTGLSLRCLKD